MSTSLFSGARSVALAYVTLDGHGEMNADADALPCKSRSCSMARRAQPGPAATSTGGFKGSRCGIRFGEPHPDQPDHADGHAVLISGSCPSCSDHDSDRVASLTSFCSRPHLEHVVKTHKQKRMQHNVDVI